MVADVIVNRERFADGEAFLLAGSQSVYNELRRVEAKEDAQS
jgi:hypothetical protein